MSGPPDQSKLAENELVFFFSTNERVPAGLVASFIREIEKVALSARHMGPAGAVEIVEVRTGSVSVRVQLWATLVGTAFTGFQVALDVADKLQQPSAPIAKCAARMVAEHGVVKTQVVTRQGTFEISREMMPAVARIEKTKPLLHSDFEAPSSQRRDRTLRVPALTDVPEVYLENGAGLRAPDLSVLFEAPKLSPDLKKMRGYFKTINNAALTFITRHGKQLPVRAANPPLHLAERAQQVELYYLEADDHKTAEIYGLRWLKQ